MTDLALPDLQARFGAAVNMSSPEIAAWLETPESRSVGWVRGKGQKTGPDGPESIGHRSGRRIAEILGKHPAELDDDDYDQMRRTVAFVRRHSAQRPAGDVSRTRWRYSLMNWGHDPLKADL